MVVSTPSTALDPDDLLGRGRDCRLDLLAGVFDEALSSTIRRISSPRPGETAELN